MAGRVALTEWFAGSAEAGGRMSPIHYDEEVIGFGLQVRDNGLRTFTLDCTVEGADLHERVLRLLREVEEIEQAALAARAEPAGILKVAAPLPLGLHLLAPAMPRFRARYPKLTVDLRLSDRMPGIVEEGVDVAIRVGEFADSRLISRRLAPHRVCAFASPDYLRRRGTPQHPDDLVHHDCVNFRYQGSGQSLLWPFLIGKRLVEITPDHGIVTDLSEAVAAIVAAGGIGISPIYLAASHVRRGALVPALREFAADRSVITALWPESRRGSPSVKAFLALLDEIFPSPAPWDSLIATHS